MENFVVAKFATVAKLHNVSGNAKKNAEKQKICRNFRFTQSQINFNWSAETITYSIIFFCCGVMLLKQKVLNLEENIIDKIFMWVGG